MSLTNRRMVLVLAGLLVTWAPSAVRGANNLLVDPGFEGLIVYDGPPAVGGWDGFSDTPGTVSGAGFGSGAQRTGAQQATLFTTGNDHFAGIFQDVLVGEGSRVAFEGWHVDASLSNGQGIEIRLEYLDSGTGTEIGSTPNATPDALGAAYEPFAITGTVPVGADTVRAVYAVSSFGGPIRQRIYVDDVSLRIIPEPASLLLLIGLGGPLLSLRSTRR